MDTFFILVIYDLEYFKTKRHALYVTYIYIRTYVHSCITEFSIILYKITILTI